MNFSRQPDKLFFSTPFWLPPNVTWDYFERFDTGDGFQFPSVKDLYAAWKLVPLFLIAKYGVEKWVTICFIAPILLKVCTYLSDVLFFKHSLYYRKKQVRTFYRLVNTLVWLAQCSDLSFLKCFLRSQHFPKQEWLMRQSRSVPMHPMKNICFC